MNNWQRLINAKGKTFLLRVEASGDSADYEKYEFLRNEIWGFPEDSLPGSRNLMCENFLHDGGALIISVYEVGPKAEVTADAGRPGRLFLRVRRGEGQRDRFSENR